MLPPYLLFSNWINIHYMLFKLKICDTAPILSSILATVFFIALFSHTKASRELFIFLFCIHVILPIDLLFIQQNVPYNIYNEVGLFILYNIFLFIVFDKTFHEIYFIDIINKHNLEPNMSIKDFIKKMIFVI